jgi:glutathione S-transferase
MLTVWGRATSSNTQAVLWALAEIGVDFERIDAGGIYGRTDTPEFGAMNPNRLVPVLIDGDLTLWESAAIVRYLGARYADASFWPVDPAVRAGIDKWAEWMKTTFVPCFITGIFWPTMRAAKITPDPAAFSSALARMKQVAAILESGVPDRGTFGGAALTFADIMVGTYLYRYFDLPFDRAETPRLLAYYRRLGERPAYRQHVMVSYESLRQT